MDKKPDATGPLERMHGLVEQIAGRFRGYLPWPDDKRDAVVRGHEAAIADTIKKADAILDEQATRSESASTVLIDEARDTIEAMKELWLGLHPNDEMPEYVEATLHNLDVAMERSATPSANATSTEDAALLEMCHGTLRELVTRIEKCGASPELTHAVTLCSDLMMAVGRDTYAAQRVRDAVKP